jgi:hypothetical protein
MPSLETKEFLSNPSPLIPSPCPRRGLGRGPTPLCENQLPLRQRFLGLNSPPPTNCDRTTSPSPSPKIRNRNNQVQSEAGVVAAASAWILSRREDLIWFQGSALAGIALLLLFVVLQRSGASPYTLSYPALMAVFLWGTLFDGTHVWGTYSRTYFAPDAASRAGLPDIWSWGLLAVGPATAIVAAALGREKSFQLFVMAAYLWAYWHLVRQHYGFMMLYRKRAGENDLRGARLDGLILWAGCLYPFVRFSLGDAYAHSGLPLLLPAAALAPARLLLDAAFVVAAAILLKTLFAQTIEPLRPGPKHLLLAIVIAFHFAVFAMLDNLLAILATLTIFHNLQYHRIVWLHERGRGQTPSGGLFPYLAYGLCLGAIWYGIRILGVAAVHSELPRNLLIGLGWGVAFHHYLVDGRIWHVHRSTTVSGALSAGAQTP